MTATTPTTLELTGASGKKYTFYVYPYGQTFKAVGGVYAITRATPNPKGGNLHKIIYVGHSGNLSERFDDHHKEDCFKRNQANQHCVLVEESEKARLAIEADLIAAYNPPCNG